MALSLFPPDPKTPFAFGFETKLIKPGDTGPTNTTRPTAFSKALKAGGPAHAGLSLSEVARAMSQATPRAKDARVSYAGKLTEVVDAYDAACTLANAAHSTLGDTAWEMRARVRRSLERSGKRHIREAYRAQWRAGKDTGGNLARFTKDERLLLDKLTRAQFAFFDNLLHDIEEGVASRAGAVPLDKRAAMYAQCSAEAFWAGLVLSDLSHDTYYQWEFCATAEHCGDCLKLAKGGRWGTGVYVARELAAMGVFPGSGQLACCTHCQCELKPVARPQAAPKGELWTSIKLKGPGSSSFEGESRTDRTHLQKRLGRAKWRFRGRLTKALSLFGLSSGDSDSNSNDGGANQDETPKPYKYGSTQFDLGGDIGAVWRGWARLCVSGDKLASDGFEDDLHVTVKYGIESDAEEAQRDLAAICEPWPDVLFTSGPLGIFRHSPDHDVLYVSVHSKDLPALHHDIMQGTICIPDQWPYTPHITLAYVKKGSVDHLEGNKELAGLDFRAVQLTLSSRDRRKIIVPLGSYESSANAEEKHGAEPSEESRALRKSLNLLGESEANTQKKTPKKILPIDLFGSESPTPDAPSPSPTPRVSLFS